jgi:hypothetical protein
MKTYHLIVIVILGVFNTAKGQALDSASYGNDEYRPVMGGGQRVNRSAKAPLNELIQRLEKPWQLVWTGKAYWIGYTDDMYLIADHKNEAIPLLVNFIDTATNVKAQKGGLYTLHLIGIDEKVAGRFSENFVNKKARTALLRYLNDKSLHETVVYLLMRDPWLSDIPKLMDYLCKPDRDYSKVLSALQRYEFDNKPIGQIIDTNITNKQIDISHTGNNTPEPAYSIDELISYQTALGSRFLVDREIEKSHEWINGKVRLSKMKLYKNSEQFGFGFSFLIRDGFNFCEFQESFFYTFHDHKLTIYGPIKTRQIWINWWNKLSDRERELFFAYRHIPFSEKYKQ